MAINIGAVGGAWGTAGELVVGVGLSFEIWQELLPGLVVDITSLAINPVAQQAAVDKWCLICNAIAKGTGAHIQDNAQSIEAANQLVYLKDRLAATDTILQNTNASLMQISTQLTALCTAMVAQETDDAAVNANILLMITAWQALNIGLSLPDPTGSGVAASAAVTIFQNVMTHPLTGLINGTNVLSWTTLVANHAARGIAVGAQIAVISSTMALITADLAAIGAEQPLLATVTAPTSDDII